MSVCALAGGKLLAVLGTAFTLSWTHSVERTEWQESWQETPAGLLELAEARVKGSGAGMDPPEGAVRGEGWWRWKPALPPQREIVLASSGATGSGWRLCSEGRCLEIGDRSGAPIRLRPCASSDSRSAIGRESGVRFR